MAKRHKRVPPANRMQSYTKLGYKAKAGQFFFCHGAATTAHGAAGQRGLPAIVGTAPVHPIPSGIGRKSAEVASMFIAWCDFSISRLALWVANPELDNSRPKPKLKMMAGRKGIIKKRPAVAARRMGIIGKGGGRGAYLRARVWVMPCSRWQMRTSMPNLSCRCSARCWAL